MIAPESLASRGGRRGTTDRASYLIDRFQVIYAFGGGWTCGCRSSRPTTLASTRARRRVAEPLNYGSRNTSSSPPSRRCPSV